MREPQELQNDRETNERASIRSPFFKQLVPIGRSWGWLLAAGVVYLIIGIFALSWPVHSTVGMALALGVILVVGGVASLFHAFTLRRGGSIGWQIFQAVAALIAGVLVLRYPASGMIGMAIALTFYLIVSAAIKGGIAMSMRPHRGWGLVLASAIVSLALGIYIIATFPVSALWIPGLLLGIDFVVSGASLIGFAGVLRSAHHKALRAAENAPEAERKRAA